MSKLGRKSKIAVFGGRGVSACSARSKAMKTIGKPKVNSKGIYRVRVKVAAKSDWPLVVRTRARGKRSTYSQFMMR